ncbi:MAG: FecR domain-containing protein [Sphingomonas sp.]
MTGRTAADIQSDAAWWVVRMDEDAWSDAQENELQAWLKTDARHRGALLRAQAAWMTLDKPNTEAEVDDAADRQAGWWTRRRLFAGGSAVIAASLAGGLVLLNNATSYTTAVGEIRRVPLADGSTAAINTASVVHIELGAATRNVKIDKGEAWFQVAKDRSRPFIVSAGRVRVEAVGTAFSVRRRDNGADILVTEGVVEAWADGAEGHRIRLTAGNSAFIADNAAIEKLPVAASSVDRTLAWRSGKIDLAGEPLADAVAEFNRYNRRQLVIADGPLAHEQIDGVFRTDDPEGFAQALKVTLDAQVDLSNPNEIRIGQRKN